jgi:hypothetical protein
MLYEMKRIELAHPGSIMPGMPPQGLERGLGRKWSVEVEFMGSQEGNEYCNHDVDDYWRIKAHSEAILCPDACHA